MTRSTHLAQRLLAVAVLVFSSGVTRCPAQSGVRTHLYNAYFIANEAKQRGIVLGLGYDHDMFNSVAFGVDADYLVVSFNSNEGPYDARAYQLVYRAYYLTSGNQESSFYFGSRLGLRRTTCSDEATWSVPVGLRLGVRGGLEGFFADLFAEFGMQAAGSTPAGYSMTGPEVHVGLDIGFGWLGSGRAYGSTQGNGR